MALISVVILLLSLMLQDTASEFNPPAGDPGQMHAL